MAKVLRCKDIGMEGCDFEARAETEDELLEQAAQHAAQVHEITEMTPDLVEKVRGAIADA